MTDYRPESLKDLIEKSRNSSNSSSLMNKTLNDIKTELKSSDKNIKVQAITKLLFLYLHQYDIKWASFNNLLEIIPTCGAKGKRFGYLLAQLQIKNNSDCIQLIPSCLRKDLQAQNLNYMNSALNLVNNIMDYNLAVEMVKDMENLLRINNNLIRKKLIIGLTKVAQKFLQNPQNNFANKFWEDLLIRFSSLLEKKEDLSNGVAICIISSIQQICKLYPDKCLIIYPALINYFSTCEINWNLIKIVDIFGMFLNVQPKIANDKMFIQKVAENLTKTKSKSVEVQLVKLVIMNFDPTTKSKISTLITELIKNCEDRLKSLLFFHDGNLVVISLRILKELFHKSKLTASNYIQDILKILDQSCTVGAANKNIQSECLEIIKLSLSKENYKMIVEHLWEKTQNLGTKGILTILDICSYDTYSRLESKENFIWFLNILFNLCEQELGKDTEMEIARLIRDICQRISVLKDFICEKSVSMIRKLISKLNENFHFDEKQNILGGNDIIYGIKKSKNRPISDSLISVLCFIIGEYLEQQEAIEMCVKYFFNLFDLKYEDNFAMEQDINQHAAEDKSKQHVQARNMYFIQVSTCLVKLLLKTKNKEFVDKWIDNMELISKKINFTDLESLDMSVILTCLINRIRNSEEKISDLEILSKSFFNNKLPPLQANAQSLVPLDFDITLNLPINEEELKIDGNRKEENDLNYSSNLPNQILSKDQNINESMIDKTLYTPNTNK
jgi:hypothetical protein